MSESKSRYTVQQPDDDGWFYVVDVDYEFVTWSTMSCLGVVLIPGRLDFEDGTGVYCTPDHDRAVRLAEAWTMFSHTMQDIHSLPSKVA